MVSSYLTFVQSYLLIPLGVLKDIELTRKRDGQTDGQTDRQTDNGAKNNMSPHFIGGDITHSNVYTFTRVFYQFKPKITTARVASICVLTDLVAI